MNLSKSAVRLTNASDAIAWKSCRRRAWFDLREPDFGYAPDAFEQLIMQAGMEHERAVLSSLGEYQTAIDEAHTAELIRAKTPIVYQPKFRDDALRVIAQPDFLFLEDGAYRAADAKLARSLDKKTGVRIQLGVYQRVIKSDLNTGALLGGGTSELIADKDLANADKFLADMAILAESDRPEAHFGATKCGKCPYRDVCVPEFQSSGDLGQNYFVDGRAIPRLNELGIQTLTDLSKSDAGELPDIPYFKGEKKRKAILHANAFLNQKVIVLADPRPIAGTPIHFDIETNPLAADGAEEVYLWGFLPPPYKSPNFEYIWHDGGAENDQGAWHEFFAAISKYRAQYPDAVFVHYAPFEHQVITRYARKFGALDNPIVKWLLKDGGLLDLKTVAKTLILPTTGYGLKEICKRTDLVNFQWELQESGSQWSVVRFHDFSSVDDEEERAAIKQEILTYNRDDVRATRALEQWLDKFG